MMLDKYTINIISLSIIFTLSLYHILIFFGRRQVKSEYYNLFFSLVGFTLLLSFIFANPSGVYK
jgi:energy-coupling factor transporter transmembrane protein EcfT